jgi:tol-pal system protein YbgF
MMRLKHTLAAALMAAFSCASLSAHAALFGDDEARKAILDLRTQVAGKADASAILELSNQNDMLRQEVARLNGRIEVLNNQVTTLQQQQKSFYVDLDTRLRKLEPKSVTVDGQQAMVGQNEQQAYDNALTLFKSGDYKKSGAAFADFINTYPASAYAPSAQYWVGNAYYSQSDYRSAIAAQKTLISKYPDNPKVPDAMLNIASSEIALKDKTSAKKMLHALIEKYPDAPAAQTAKERLDNLK